MADKPYVLVYNTRMAPLILDSAYDDPDNIDNILPHDVEIGTLAIVDDDSGHRYIFGRNKTWKPYANNSGGGSSGCALAMTDVSSTGM